VPRLDAHASLELELTRVGAGSRLTGRHDDRHDGQPEEGYQEQDEEHPAPG